jgi:hypothetical protein
MVNKHENEHSLSKAADSPRNTGTGLSPAKPAKELESWNGAIDVTPYKQALVWPGHNYCLMGNSFNIELGDASSPENIVRGIAIKSILSSTGSGIACLSVREALSRQEFLKVLSRFERDWLTRLRPDSLIGPAFNERGDLLHEAFSVWRRDFVTSGGAFTRH